jgi:hypothetical protein
MATIDIVVGCSDGVIDAVRIDARMPNPARALVGLSPSAVAGVLGRLYAVCGSAQRACAELTLAAAAGVALAPDRHGRLAAAVAAEAIQEHLWRLWLDWPVALGTAAAREAFTGWYGAIQAGASDWPARLLATLEQDWLGMPAAALAEFDRLDHFDHWHASTATPAAQLFARLNTEAAAAPKPGQPARPAGTLDTPLEAVRGHRWIASLQDSGRALEALLATRVVSLHALLQALNTDPPRTIDMAATAAGPGRGLGSVATARGWLEHDATLGGALVDAYLIHTPTERHFAADGPFVAQLRGMPVADARQAARAASLWALAFDPCVSHAVAVGGDLDA